MVQNPVYAFGHVSFVIGDQSYSWQAHIDPKTGQEDWSVAPAAEYIRQKQKDGSHGTGYYLDFGSKENPGNYAVSGGTLRR